MSFDGQVLCQRMLIGPAWPLAIIGKPSAATPPATPVAAFRKLRRVLVLTVDCVERNFDLRVMAPPSTACMRDLKGLALGRPQMPAAGNGRCPRSATDYTRDAGCVQRRRCGEGLRTIPPRRAARAAPAPACRCRRIRVRRRPEPRGRAA